MRQILDDNNYNNNYYYYYHTVHVHPKMSFTLSCEMAASYMVQFCQYFVIYTNQNKIIATGVRTSQDYLLQRFRLANKILYIINVFVAL